MIISRFPHRKAVSAKKRLDYNDWDTIAKVSAAGQAKNYWAVGDTKEIIINGTVGKTTFSSLSIWAFIIGFDHNADLEGRNTIHFQIGKSAQFDGENLCLVDAKYGTATTSAGYFNMSYSNANTGGWESSKMRTVLLGSNYTPSVPLSGSLLAALPAELRGVMKGVTKYTDNTGGGSDVASRVTATTDYLWLLSEFEIYGARTYANGAEKTQQKQYAYYASGNSTFTYAHNDIAASSGCWLRSPSASDAGKFCNTKRTDGGINHYNANYALGLASVFCV